MSSEFELPDNVPVTDKDGRTPVPWGQWFSRAHRILLTVSQSGTTANRPTTLLYIGRIYYDTTLNKPVWVSAVRPTVWRDASSAVV